MKRNNTKILRRQLQKYYSNITHNVQLNATRA